MHYNSKEHVRAKLKEKRIIFSIVEKDVHLFISTTFFAAFSTIKPRHCQARERHGPLDVTAEESPKLFRLDNILLPLLASKGGQGMLTPKDNMR